MKKQRLKPEVRKEAILDAAVKLAAKTHYDKLTRDGVAQSIGVTGTLIQHYFGTMPQFKRAVMRAAVKSRNLKVIAQGLVAGDKHAKAADEQLKKEALNYVSSKN